MTAGVEFMETALAQLRQHPCPVLAWKLESAFGRVKRDLGDQEQATEAFERATAIVREIAEHVDDEELRTTFLSSGAVRNACPQ